ARRGNEVNLAEGRTAQPSSSTRTAARLRDTAAVKGAGSIVATLSAPRLKSSPAEEQAAVVDLTAVVVAVTQDQPRVLVTPGQDRASVADRQMAKAELGTIALDALPSGPLEHGHRTLEAGLRAWVQAQTGARLGY